MTSAIHVSVARCQELAAAVHLPEPFDLEVLLAELAEQRGRPIRAVASRLGPEEPTGLLISTARADYIFYSEDAVPLQARHIVLHELGHLLLNHGADHGGAEDDVAVRAVTELPSKRLGDAYGRSAFGDADEVEAELFATLVALRAATVRARPRRAALAVQAAHRSLEPLWQIMVTIVPGVRFDIGDDSPVSMLVTPDDRCRYQLYRRVLEIRDAQLQLRRCVPAAVRDRALSAAQATNLPEGMAAVFAEAVELAVALAASGRVDALATDRPLRNPSILPPASPKLLADAVWLLRLAAILPCTGSGSSAAT